MAAVKDQYDILASQRRQAQLAAGGGGEVKVRWHLPHFYAIQIGRSQIRPGGLGHRHAGQGE